MSKVQRLRFVQGALFVASLIALGHERDEVVRRLGDLARAWGITDKTLAQNADEVTEEVLDAERSLMN